MEAFQKRIEIEFARITKTISELTETQASVDFDEIEHQVSKLRDLRKLAISLKLNPELVREILRAQILASDFLAKSRSRDFWGVEEG